MDWIDLVQDRDRWPAPLNTAMNLRVPQNAGNFLWLAEELLASQEGHCSVELVT
jgi:hypothetical protein